METRDVYVTLNEVIERDLEGFLDLLEELFFAQDDEEHRGILSDISYRVSGVHTNNQELEIEVSGEIERDHCGIDGCPRCDDVEGGVPRLTVTALFHPQVWVGDYAMNIDGTVPFEVSLTVEEAREIIAAGDASMEADALWQGSPMARTVDHGGPFLIEVCEALEDALKHAETP
jgi:hypothetical protein